jgi:serine protease Do
MKRSIILTSIITSMLTVLAFGTPLYEHGNLVLPKSTQVGSAVGVTLTAQTGNVVVDTVKKVNPAVVSITITENLPVIQRYYRIRSPFGVFGIPYNSGQTQNVEVGSGSGFLISADGYIITNRHVVDTADAEYTVLTNDGKEHKAEVVYKDANLDIALLKINGTNLPYLTFGDSSELLVGQSVIAIGNALGEFSNTVSVGVISGLGRTITAGDTEGNTESLDEAIQTDAAINLGNSGGPLLDLSGQVIGVNVATASDAQNVGFALPSNGVEAAINSVLHR